MYYLFLAKKWFVRNFICIHDWKIFRVGIEQQTVAECKKCEKFKVI